jgi:hypothetical protein
MHGVQLFDEVRSCLTGRLLWAMPLISLYDPLRLLPTARKEPLIGRITYLACMASLNLQIIQHTLERAWHMC